MTKEEMRALIESTQAALLRTIDLLSTEFKIYSWDFLSYEALVVILCYIYDKINHLEPAQIHRARNWFWRSSFAERYKVGGENFVSRDIQAVFDFVVNGKGNEHEFGMPPQEKEWETISFRSNVSRSRAFVLALASRSPRNLTNGAVIDPAVALSSYNKKQFHHIYPRAYLKKASKSSLDDNLLANICMIAAAGNNAISDKNPNEYLPNLTRVLGVSADAIFASNLLPIPSAFDYSSADYETFLKQRISIIQAFVDSLCSGETP